MILIGIDPDVDFTGFAVWDTQSKQFEKLDKLRFFDTCKTLSMLQPDKVIIEAGWLNKKSNYHGIKGNYSPQAKKVIGERIATKVGSNHQVGKLFAEYCTINDIPFELKIPKQSKITKENFNKMFNTKLKNQDIIDAAMLVAGY